MNESIWNESTKPNILNSTRLYFQDMFVGAKRMGRADFWWGLLGMTLLTVVLMTVFGFLMNVLSLRSFYWSAVMGVAFAMTFGYYWIAVFTATIRRLHDRNMRGWWTLLYVIPIIGELLLVIFTVLPQKNSSKWPRFID
ncbi:DUF805 domain-containing protein [Companilactobacillus baiquanensis]|uniref:DUF805 domain-containing protein n=1 Tax=Companilactobacillus baiquanensis TaxID=2486005 RepID=A0ABW1UYJ3_9LACO|nr:DUF805 domain-containing protein [Companilactobacillus baiquanensis]